MEQKARNVKTEAGGEWKEERKGQRIAGTIR